MAQANLIKMNLQTTEGKSHEVEAIFADLIKYDILRSRKNYPSRDESEFLFMGVVAFCALTRTGVLKNDTKVDDFLKTIATIEPEETEEDEAEFPAK